MSIKRWEILAGKKVLSPNFYMCSPQHTWFYDRDNKRFYCGCCDVVIKKSPWSLEVEGSKLVSETLNKMVDQGHYELVLNRNRKKQRHDCGNEHVWDFEPKKNNCYYCVHCDTKITRSLVISRMGGSWVLTQDLSDELNKIARAQANREKVFGRG